MFDCDWILCCETKLVLWSVLNWTLTQFSSMLLIHEFPPWSIQSSGGFIPTKTWLFGERSWSSFVIHEVLVETIIWLMVGGFNLAESKSQILSYPHQNIDVIIYCTSQYCICFSLFLLAGGWAPCLIYGLTHTIHLVNLDPWHIQGLHGNHSCMPILKLKGLDSEGEE